MNTEAKHDGGKLRITLVPMEIVEMIAAVREYGVLKYKTEDNWKIVEKERYRDALCRHVIAYLRDPKGMDDESGLPHLWHIATNVAFLCSLEGFCTERIVQMARIDWDKRFNKSE